MQPITTAVLIPATTKRRSLMRKDEPIIQRAAYFSKVTHKIALAIARAPTIPVVIDDVKFAKEIVFAGKHYVDAWLLKDGYKLTMIKHSIQDDPLSFVYTNPYKGVSIGHSYILLTVVIYKSNYC